MAVKALAGNDFRFEIDGDGVRVWHNSYSINRRIKTLRDLEKLVEKYC